MAEIIKTYKESIGASRFIGKKYGESDKVDGMYGALWGEWFQNEWFKAIEKAMGENAKTICEDGDAYIGLMRGGHGVPFEYWIGCFTPADTAVPEGYAHLDFPESQLAVCWIYGKESEVYALEGPSAEQLEKDGYRIKYDWCFERYACPRFTTPDEKDNIILDICFFTA